MSITLGDYTFAQRVSVAESLEELGGRDARHIRLQGLLDGFDTRAELENELDSILAAASTLEPAPLSLRTGRRFLVRRVAFKREISEAPLAGAFTLQLDAVPPHEESIDEFVNGWYFAASGATKEISTDGNVFTVPVIELEAYGTLHEPSFGDGQRTITFHGVVALGETLFFDGPNARVMLDGEDVTPYTEGAFPRIDPGGTTLIYIDAPESAHAGIATVRHRDRWW